MKMLGKTRAFEILLIFLLLTYFSFNIRLAAAQGEVILSRFNGYLTSAGYYVVGEVQNVGDTPVGNVALDITFHSVSGDFSRETGTSLPTILEGRSSPFAYFVTNLTQASQISSVSVSVKTFAETETKPANLEITHQPIGKSVIGWIKNNGDSDVSITAVFATFYDKDYTILALEMASHSELQRGVWQSFNITFPFVQNSDEAELYSLTAFSIFPEYAAEEEVVFAAMNQTGDGNGGLYNVVIVFIVVIGFSALVLVGAYVTARIKNRKKHTRTRKRKPRG
jgi:hypothetical protein